MNLGYVFSFAALIGLATWGFTGSEAAPDDVAPGDTTAPLFELLSPERTGVTFANTIVETEEYNIIEFIYTYNGAGVAVGDLNGDALPDLFFTGNQVANRLYLNKGSLRFEDISAAAGVLDSNGISNGVAMTDIDADGDLDIYVSKQNRPNKLYINNGDLTFTDRAREYGLDHLGSSTQATFLDYDLDGDVDLYLAANGDATGEGYLRRGVSDKLFRNNGDRTFTDVSAAAGIADDGYGLSATAGDVNDDGYPDVFVANDFFARSQLYINNRNGTFRESMKSTLRHTALFGMGSDIADFNNDGRLDVIEVDMLPDNHERRFKELGVTSVYSPNFDSSQQMRNVLHLNMGDGAFTDVAFMAGVARTDWSWAALFADLDNDGHKDIFIANGLKRDMNDQDFLYNIDRRKPKLEMLKSMPWVLLPNYAFRNNGDLTFTNVAAEWGLAKPVNSNGAAYADLDRDGDLDLVINNVDSAAFIYRNRAVEQKRGNYLRIALAGAKANPAGLGARITIRHKAGEQTQELTTTRGFLSSVENIVHFGLGRDTVVAELEIVWPGRATQTLRNVAVNRILTLRQNDASPGSPGVKSSRPTLFTEIPRERGLDYVHVDNDFSDFSRERLLPNRLSTSGPGVAVGDVDGNGLADLYIGGAKFRNGTLFIQSQPGFFGPTLQFSFDEDRNSEDQGAIFFDSDGDNDLDLYVVSGGNEFEPDSPELQDRLYINDGTGEFAKSTDRLPQMYTSGSVVTAADYDADGDLDLFVGGRSTPGRYPAIPRSYLLNNQRGKFVDVTERDAPDLMSPGMVTSAIWSDVDNDNAPDLLVTGEWMAPCVYRNTKGRLAHLGEKSGVAGETGWWNSIDAGDFDNDGDMDYILGNLGLNSKYRPSPQEPVELFARDFDRNGSLDLVVTYYERGVRYPTRDKQSMASQMPIMSRRFPRFIQYAQATVATMFTQGALDSAEHFAATTFASAYMENLGGGRFTLRPLPALAQASPLFGTSVQDYDADGNLDLLLAGNFYGPEPEIKRHDGSVGLLLRGNGDGTFTPVPTDESGFRAQNDARGIATFADKGSNTLFAVVANSHGRAQLFTRVLEGGGRIVTLPRSKRVTHATVSLKNGRVRKVEFPIGSGYLTQHASTIVVGSNVKEVKFYNGSKVVDAARF